MTRSQRLHLLQTAMDLITMVDKDLEEPFTVGKFEKDFDALRAKLGWFLKQDL